MDEREFAPLLQGARRRELGPLAALCERVYPVVLRYMHYRVGPGFAEDLAGDVILKVIRGIAGQKGSFTAWMYRIAANVVADHVRSEKARREKPMDDEIMKQQADTSDLAGTVERQVDIQKAIGELTDDQRELITLKFIQGLSNAEIGEVTGRKPEAIRGLQFRALSSLRQVLGSEGYGHDAQ